MNKHISVNKHEFNVRRVEELNLVILEKEKELEMTTGFINTFKVKNELRKLYKQISLHGEEVIAYEVNQSTAIN